MFAEVVLSKVSRGIDKIFHYSIPAELRDKIQIGHQVLVPFGHRQDIGYVVGFVDEPEVKKVKDIFKITSEQPLFTEKQVELAKWLAEYYYSFFGTALKQVMPVGQKNSKLKAQNSKQIQNPKLQIQNILNPTEEQEKALTEIKAALEANKPETFLLYGVTGSGKTEVYMQSIAHVLEKGKSAIVLVPEISLTPQMVERFSERFGDQIAILHSHLTAKQRADYWQRIASGESRIILGARSAIFAPVKELGLIVIDEEYENSYKQEQNPRYHVREVAFFLAKQHNAVVILGSATPSIETFYHAENGTYKKLVLSQRIDAKPLPPVEIIDMRKGEGFLLSDRLREELAETLERKEQAILFLNRRGYFTFVICQECGYTVDCPHCAISLTYHTSEKKLRCNRCGYSGAPPNGCPRCNSRSIRYFGTGTQRIEKEVADIFPAARILRYDSDAVSKRCSHETFFAAFAKGQADVLIGTQMVAKGLDIANVTLVGAVSADTSLHLPDFRSAEHTFQLLTQVAGRTGRHHLPGKVIIQTYTPDHYAIKNAMTHDYENFYQQEIKHRQELSYPPFSKLVSLVISGESAPKVEKTAEDIGAFLSWRVKNVLGPAPAVIPKLRGQWRYRILLKGNELRVMRNAIKETLAKVVVPSDVKVIVDVEPMGMM
ncbi:MAG: primosomal protein N' [Candidatus Margulisiibacteriota bacterium]